MRKIFYAMIMLLVITVGAHAVPQYINYQGILRDIPGNLQNGTFAMTFKIYNAETGGIALYDPLPTQVTVSNGLYNVRLGPVDSTSIFDGNNRWLEVTVGSDLLSPRLRINSVAYALRADVAGTAASATYAATSGTATDAAHAVNADKVNNIAANTSATANALYPLDSSGTLSGIPISATASGTNNALLINSGKIGISPVGSGGSTTGIVGKATLPSGVNNILITNPSVSQSSIILITPRDFIWAFSSSLRVSTVNDGSFKVETSDGSSPLNPNTIPFNYLIIN